MNLFLLTISHPFGHLCTFSGHYCLLVEHFWFCLNQHNLFKSTVLRLLIADEEIFLQTDVQTICSVVVFGHQPQLQLRLGSLHEFVGCVVRGIFGLLFGYVMYLQPIYECKTIFIFFSVGKRIRGGKSSGSFGSLKYYSATSCWEFPNF